MTWRGAVWGLLAGGMLGFVYGLVVLLVLTLADTSSKDWTKLNAEATSALIILAIISGTLFGAPIGFIAGAADGFVIALLTRLFFSPLKNAGAYRLIIALISGFFTLIVAGLGLFGISVATSMVIDNGVRILVIGLPAIIAAIAAALISILITRWYIKASAK
jgi:hypothetical protein